MCESIKAASRLCALVIAWKSPWRCRLILAAGSTCERPPPAAPPFIPNTGPSDGSREERIARLPITSSPCTSPIDVTVLPSPETVGVVAVTRISLPPRLNLPSFSSSRLNFPLTGLRFSYRSSGKSSLAAIASIGNRFFFTQYPQQPSHHVHCCSKDIWFCSQINKPTPK